MSSQAPLLSIFETVKENPANPLPDQQDLTLQSEELWVAGAYEGTLLRSDFSIKQPLLVNYWVARKIKKYILQPSEKKQKGSGILYFQIQRHFSGGSGAVLFIWNAAGAFQNVSSRTHAGRQLLTQRNR